MNVRGDDDSLRSARHDLRNKLGSIKNAVYYLKKKSETGDLDSDARVKQFLDLIDAEIRAALGLVDALRPAADAPVTERHE